MDSVFALEVEAALLAAGTILIEESINFIIRRAAKISGATTSVIRDIEVGFRVIAALVIMAGILSITGLASAFTVITLSGIGAIAVSLILQNTLTNIISGILLLTDGAIRLNDEIEFGGIRGKIVRIALRNTWIKKEDGKIAIVSNSSLSGGPMINHTAVARLSKRYRFE